MRFKARLAIVPFFLFLCGCGSGSDPIGPILTLSPGNWQINMTSTANPGALGGASLSQTGTTVTGIMHLVSPQCFALLDVINVNATVNGPTLQLTASSATGQTISVTATGSATALSGTYTMGGSGCPQDSGKFSAILVPPATGSWHGTLTSASGPITQVTATLTQSGPTANGFFLVSGNMTFSGSCLSSGSVTISVAFGATYLLNVGPNPETIPSLAIFGSMTDPATANALSGSYGSIDSTCTDTGTVSLTRP